MCYFALINDLSLFSEKVQSSVTGKSPVISNYDRSEKCEGCGSTYRCLKKHLAKKSECRVFYPTAKCLEESDFTESQDEGN